MISHPIDLIHPRNRDHVGSNRIEIRSSSFAQTLTDARSVRATVYGAESPGVVDDIDAHSTVYCAYVDGTAVGTLRVTRARLGPIDCESFYPPSLLNRFRDLIGSASRYCVLPGTSANLRIGRLLVEGGWIEHADMGCRLDLIDVREEFVGYYRRMGYLLIAGHQFIHPVWATRSRVMVYPVDPERPGPLSHLFVGIERPMTEAELRAAVSIEDAT